MRRLLAVSALASLAFFMSTAGNCANASIDLAAPGAGDPFSFFFDENGNSSFDMREGGGIQPNVPGFAQFDPNTGSLALTYLLPGQIGAGIVSVTEPVSGILTDAISFYNLNGQGFMAYYSDAEGDGDTALADTISNGFVPDSGFYVSENGVEGADGFQYFSGGAPGVNNDYIGVSDGPNVVPEPATLTIWGLVGALGCAFAAVRRRKQMA